MYKRLFGSFLTVASYIGWPPKLGLCSNIAAFIDLVAPPVLVTNAGGPSSIGCPPILAYIC